MSQYLWKKFQLKDQESILVVNAPYEFSEIPLPPNAVIKTTLKGNHDFILVFIKNIKEAEIFLAKSANLLNEGGLYWAAYPKKSSRKYKSDISRDWDWKPLGELNFEPVRMIAIDDDWSALRFRPVDEIKTLNRKFALSRKGKARIEKNNN